MLFCRALTEDENNCLGVDCGHGACHDGNDTYTCDCTTGYYGEHCNGSCSQYSTR